MTGTRTERASMLEQPPALDPATGQLTIHEPPVHATSSGSGDAA